MKVKIANQIIIKAETKEEYDICDRLLREHLTFLDPKEEETGGVRRIACYKQNKTKREFLVPRGKVGILERLERAGSKISSLEDARQEGRKIELKANFELRDQIQKNAFAAYLSQPWNAGVLNLACGVGKSFIAIKIIEFLKVKTVILVDEIFLASQWNLYLTKNTDIDTDKILMLTGKTKKKDLERLDTADIIIASKDSVIGKREMIEKLDKGAGLVIVDEGHTAAAKVFTEVIGEFNTRWILGLTATAERDDGLSFLVHALVGDTVYKATIFDSVALGSSILPVLRPIYLRKTFDHEITGKEHYSKMTDLVMRDEASLNVLTAIIKTHYDADDYQLVITQRVEESYIVKEKLMAFGIKEEEIGIVLGVTDLKKREEIVAKVETGEVKVIISSTVFDKGVSANRLNILHNYYPSKEVANTIQRAGKRTESARLKAC